jgi:hypothetical protein
MEKLNVHARNITSQWGEDGIIEYIISKVPEIPKICCDLGAWDGVFLSNTHALWHDKGWEGILIECSPEKVRNIEKNFPDCKIKVIEAHVSPHGECSVDSMFEQNGLPLNIGLLSIDIDSCDYHVWKHLTKVSPAIVIVEHNPTIPGYVEYYDLEEERFLLCSAKSLERLGKEKGYKLICCTQTNSIFVKENFFNPEYFPDLPVEALFDYSLCNQTVMVALPQGRRWARQRVCYGKPRGVLRTVVPIVNRVRSLFNKNYRRPPEKVVKNMEKFDFYLL